MKEDGGFKHAQCMLFSTVLWVSPPFYTTRVVTIPHYGQFNVFSHLTKRGLGTQSICSTSPLLSKQKTGNTEGVMKLGLV